MQKTFSCASKKIKNKKSKLLKRNKDNENKAKKEKKKKSKSTKKKKPTRLVWNHSCCGNFYFIVWFRCFHWSGSIESWQKLDVASSFLNNNRNVNIMGESFKRKKEKKKWKWETRKTKNMNIRVEANVSKKKNQSNSSAKVASCIKAYLIHLLQTSSIMFLFNQDVYNSIMCM